MSFHGKQAFFPGGIKKRIERAVNHTPLTRPCYTRIGCGVRGLRFPRSPVPLLPTPYSLLPNTEVHRLGTHATRIQDHHAGHGGHHIQQGHRLRARYDPCQLFRHGHGQRRLCFGVQPVLPAGAAVQFLHIGHADPPVRAGAGAAEPQALQPLRLQHHQPVRAGGACDLGALLPAGEAAGAPDLHGLRRRKGRPHGKAGAGDAAVADVQRHLHKPRQPSERHGQVRGRPADRLPAPS